jgi:hypothetical protein
MAQIEQLQRDLAAAQASREHAKEVSSIALKMVELLLEGYTKEEFISRFGDNVTFDDSLARLEKIMGSVENIQEASDIEMLEVLLRLARVQEIEWFVERVNVRAEENMEKTGRLEGSHYAAMQVELEIVREGQGQ